MNGAIVGVVHVLELMLLPPLLSGVINKTKALFAGRRGPPVLQLYFDLAKLARKGLVTSHTTTAMFVFAPLATLVATVAAALFVPLGLGPTPFGFAGDFVVVLGLLALGRALTTLAALDTGSAFEGMGATRELTFAVLAEPALLFAFLVLARLSGSLSLGPMMCSGPAQAGSMAPLALVAAGVGIVLLAENSRIPVDDPNTHLELTMIHEVIILDHSGPLLAAVLHGAAIKLMLFAALIVHLVLPAFSAGADPWLVFVLVHVGLLVVAVAIGVIESVMARLRMGSVPNLLSGAVLLTAFGFLLVAAT